MLRLTADEKKERKNIINKIISNNKKISKIK